MAELQPLDIIVRVQQKEQLDQLTLQAAKATGEIVKLNKQLQDGVLNQAQFNAQAKGFAVTVSSLVPQIKQLEGAIGQQGLGRGLGQLAYAIDDVQYGFNAIVNNIPQIVLGLGYGMGVAGAAGIAAVAINQLSKHWNDFFGSPEMADAAEKLEKAAEGFKKLADAQSKWVAMSGHQLTAAMPNLPGGVHGLERSLTDSLMATKQGEGAESGVWAFMKVLAFGHRKTPYEMTGDKVRGLMSRMAGGDQQARSELQAIMDRTPSAFTPEQHQMMKSADPGHLKKAAGEKEDKELMKEGIDNQNQQLFRQRDAERQLRKENRMQALQDQEEALREKEHQIRFAASMRKGDSAAYGSTKAMLADIHQGAYDAGATVGKNQLKRLEMIHLELVKLREQEKQIKRGANFQ